MTTTLKLSEAIRLGSLLRPQGFRVYRDSLDRSCALGAAQDAMGVAFPSDLVIFTAWPWMEQPSVCPLYCGAVGYFPSSMIGVISHLNDDHLWTRERIADWVETVEPREAESTVEAPAIAQETVSV